MAKLTYGMKYCLEMEHKTHNRREEHGWSFSPSVNFSWNTTLCFDQTFVCKCGHTCCVDDEYKNNCNTLDRVCCTECWLVMDNTINTILNTRTTKFTDLVIHESIDGNSRADIDEVTPVQTTIDNVHYYGIIRIKVWFEQNEWSSTPHDDYIINGYWYTDESVRNSNLNFVE